METTDSKYTSSLNDGSLVERLGSFVPPTRKGYGEGRPEKKIQDRVAKKLYAKRVPIAQKMVDSSSTSTKEVAYSALVYSGFSPHSVDYFEQYVQILVDRQGGWGRWRGQVSRDLKGVEYLRKSILTPLIVLIVWLVFVGVFSATTDFGSIVGNIAPLLLTVGGLVVFSIVMVARIPQYTKGIEELIGPKDKSTKEFFQYYWVNRSGAGALD